MAVKILVILSLYIKSETKQLVLVLFMCCNGNKSVSQQIIRVINIIKDIFPSNISPSIHQTAIDIKEHHKKWLEENKN